MLVTHMNNFVGNITAHFIPLENSKSELHLSGRSSVLSIISTINHSQLKAPRMSEN